MSVKIELPMGIVEIRKLLPHRYPMLMVDRVTEFHEGERIVGIKAVSVNEPFFTGHFPERPVMPGVFMLEALAQLGVLFAKLSTGVVREEQLIVFAGVDEVKWRRLVIPGDLLEMEMKLIKRRAGIWKMAGTAAVNGERAVEGILTAAEAK